MGNWLSRHHTIVEAVEAGDCERVKRLLDEGADVNAKNDAGTSCLVIAAENHADLENHTASRERVRR